MVTEAVFVVTLLITFGFAVLGFGFVLDLGLYTCLLYVESKVHPKTPNPEPRYVE